jgi:ABC-type lipoprotein release transport system permease subunit
MIAAPVALLASALAAIGKPAWDAAAVDPAVALRDE